MKKGTVNTVKLGVFVTLGLVLFTIAIYFIGQKRRLFSSVFHVNGIFRDVSGLQVGNNVRFSGINVGTVAAIDIVTDTAVVVDMILDEDVREFIRTDSRAVIGSEGLMGNRIVNIIPGTRGEMVSDNTYLQTASPINLDEIFGKLQKTVDNTESITGSLAGIMESIRSGKGTIGKLFMDSAFAKNLDQTLVNVKRGTKGFEENMDAVKNSFLFKGSKKNKEKKKAVDEKKDNREKNK